MMLEEVLTTDEGEGVIVMRALYLYRSDDESIKIRVYLQNRSEADDVRVGGVACCCVDVIIFLWWKFFVVLSDQMGIF